MKSSSHMKGRLLSFVAVLAVAALSAQLVYSQQQINILTRGTGGVGSLMLGVSQGASGAGQNTLMMTGSGAPTSGTSGTGVRLAPPGSLYADVTNFRWYVNANTTASPLWYNAFGYAGSTQYAEVSLTNAQMLALRATPISLVAAPGAGKLLEFISAQLFFDYTGAYTETADNMAVKFTDGSGAAVSQTIEATGFVDATADTVTNGLAKIDAIVAATSAANQALVLHNTGSGEYGGGNAANAVRVKVAYRVHSTGL